MKLFEHNDTFFFCATHRMPLFNPPKWMTLIKTGLFDCENSIEASTLVPKYDLLYCYLKGDVAVLAARRLLEAGIEAGEVNEDSFVCSSSYRKFVATKPIGTPSANLPDHCRILIQDTFESGTLWDDMSGKIVLPRFLNYKERLGVAAVYARDHTSFAAYLSCISLLLDEGLFNKQDAVGFLAMHGHFLWGFAGTVKLKHFLILTNQFEFAAVTFLKHGLVSKESWKSEHQDRWMAFFLERMTSYFYLKLLASDGLLSWNSDGSFSVASEVVQGYNCNVNTPSEPANVLQTGP